MKVCIACDEKFNSSGWCCPVCGFIPHTLEGYQCFSPELARVNEGFRVESFSDLFVLEDHNFWFTSRNNLIAWTMQKYFPRARNFLEIGCGTGYVLSGIQRLCPNLTLSGSEISVNGLEFTSQRLNNVDLFQMDARKIPFDREFDVIGAFDVIEHIKEDQTVLSEMYRATNKGGGVLITVPQHPFLWSSSDEFACHERRYTSQDLRLKVEQAGFEIPLMTSFVSLLFPAMALSRILNKNSKKEPDPTREFKIKPIFNKSFAGILSIEMLLIKAGVHFPFGGSLLLVGRKV